MLTSSNSPNADTGVHVFVFRPGSAGTGDGQERHEPPPARVHGDVFDEERPGRPDGDLQETHHSERRQVRTRCWALWRDSDDSRANRTESWISLSLTSSTGSRPRSSLWRWTTRTARRRRRRGKSRLSPPTPRAATRAATPTPPSLLWPGGNPNTHWNTHTHTHTHTDVTSHRCSSLPLSGVWQEFTHLIFCLSGFCWSKVDFYWSHDSRWFKVTPGLFKKKKEIA